jgi:(p)ppGpp synthase/HD superfamily hydrolase
LSYFSLWKSSRKKVIEREKRIERVVKKLLSEAGIESEIQCRVKSVFSFYKKILKKNLLHSQITDNEGVRIIVKKKSDCYKAMSVIMWQWDVVENKIKDYIAIPKENGYQSLHLTIIHNGYPIEVQIRTEEMHYHAQYGIAAHRKYKNLEYV